MHGGFIPESNASVNVFRNEEVGGSIIGHTDRKDSTSGSLIQMEDGAKFLKFSRRHLWMCPDFGQLAGP